MSCRSSEAIIGCCKKSDPADLGGETLFSSIESRIVFYWRQHFVVSGFNFVLFKFFHVFSGKMFFQSRFVLPMI